MKLKGSKKMRGFMCQSPGDTAVVCMTTGDRRSVIVPKRLVDRPTTMPHHHAKLLKNTNYIRLGGDGGRNIVPPPLPLACANKTKSNLNKSINDEDVHKKQIQNIPTAQLALANQVFQVVYIISYV